MTLPLADRAWVGPSQVAKQVVRIARAVCPDMPLHTTESAASMTSGKRSSSQQLPSFYRRRSSVGRVDLEPLPQGRRLSQTGADGQGAGATPDGSPPSMLPNRVLGKTPLRSAAQRIDGRLVDADVDD